MRTDPSKTQAQHRPVGRPRKETNSGEMEMRDVPPLVFANSGPIVREAETIVLPETEVRSDYLAELAFMEEPVTIRLERSSEKMAPTLLDFWVNGKPKWIPVGQPFTVERKYVEVIARAQPYSVQTEVINPEVDDPINKAHRYPSAKFPFSVLRDPSPRGFDWLTNIMKTA